MAKLGARGRTEVARYERMVGTGQDRYRLTYALMSDGSVLKKAQWFNDDGTIRPGQWRQWGKIKPGLQASNLMERMRQWDGVVEKIIRKDLVDAVLRKAK